MDENEELVRRIYPELITVKNKYGFYIIRANVFYSATHYRYRDDLARHILTTVGSSGKNWNDAWEQAATFVKRRMATVLEDF